MNEITSEQASDSSPPRRGDPLRAHNASEALDAELNTAQTRYRILHRAEMDGVRNLNFAKDKLRQTISAHEAAKSRLDAADNRGQRADRGAYEAKRDVRDARQRGEVVTRFMAAVRRTDLEAKREGHVTRRIQDEARRKGEELRLAEDDLKRWSAEVDRRVASASRQRARLKELVDRNL